MTGESIENVFVIKMELVRYRDWGMPTYTWFWINSQNQVISPYFDSEADAVKWAQAQKVKAPVDSK